MNGHIEIRPSSPTELLTTDRLANWLLFKNSVIFIYLNSYQSELCHLAIIIIIITSSPTYSKSTVMISPIKPVTDKIWIHFLKNILVFLCWTLCTFQLYLHFWTNVLANLTANWKTHGLTKPCNKINQHGNGATWVDHLVHLVVSSLILLLCKFAAFAYYLIDTFASFTTRPTFAILLRLIYSCFDMIGSNVVVLCCY